MKVKMLTDAPGSPDGVTVNEYNKSVVYDVTDSLGEAFASNGLAEVIEDDVTSDVTLVVEPVGADEEVKPSGNKKDTGPSENKSA